MQIHTRTRNDTKMLACTLTYTCLCLYLCHSHFLICYTLSLPFSFSLFIFLSCICEMSILKSTQKSRKTHLHDLQVLSFKPGPRPGSSHALDQDQATPTSSQNHDQKKNHDRRFVASDPTCCDFFSERPT